MRDGPPTERCTAALALARTGSKEAFDILKQELLGAPRDRNWAKAVSRTMGRQYGKELTAWIESDQPCLDDLPAVLWTLARSDHMRIGPLVEGFFREGTPSMRAAALRILARQNAIDLLPELRRCLREGKPRKVAQEAFWQMFRLRDAAMPTVQEMLKSEHWPERKAAVCLLQRWGQLTPEQTREANADPHVAVREAAV